MLEFVSNLRSERHLVRTNLETSHNSSLLELRVKRTMILFRRMYRWKKIVLGNFHSSCRIGFPIYSISRIASGSHKVLPLSSSRFQQERAVPSNLVRFFENSRTVTDSSLSNDFSRIHFQIHPCVRETERECTHAKFLALHSPLHPDLADDVIIIAWPLLA